MTYKACLDCGEPCPATRCEDCAPTTATLRGLSPRERGYDAAWDRLSKLARTLQPWCSDCSTEDNLTADHKPTAWARKERGLPLRLVDVDVCCSDCNVKRGSSRPGTERASQPAPWGVDPSRPPSGPVRKDESLTLSPPAPTSSPSTGGNGCGNQPFPSLAVTGMQIRRSEAPCPVADSDGNDFGTTWPVDSRRPTHDEVMWDGTGSETGNGNTSGLVSSDG